MVSSAYNCTLLHVRVNSKEPNIDPCGTPLQQLYLKPFKTTVVSRNMLTNGEQLIEENVVSGLEKFKHRPKCDCFEMTKHTNQIM